MDRENGAIRRMCHLDLVTERQQGVVDCGTKKKMVPPVERFCPGEQATALGPMPVILEGDCILETHGMDGYTEVSL